MAVKADRENGNLAVYVMRLQHVVELVEELWNPRFNEFQLAGVEQRLFSAV